MKIWDSTPNSLIGFESDNYTSLHTVIKNGGHLFKIGEKIKVYNSKDVTDKDDLNNPPEYLCKIQPQKDHYDIEMLDDLSTSVDTVNLDVDNVPWIISKYVFDNSREHGYKLHQGDLFKLGKYLLKVREIKNKCSDCDRKITYEVIDNFKKNINNEANGIIDVSNVPLQNHRKDAIGFLNYQENHELNENDNNIFNGEINNENIELNQNNNNVNNIIEISEPSNSINRNENNNDINENINNVNDNSRQQINNMQINSNDINLIQNKNNKDKNQNNQIFYNKSNGEDNKSELTPQIKMKSINFLNNNIKNNYSQKKRLNSWCDIMSQNISFKNKIGSVNKYQNYNSSSIIKYKKEMQNNSKFDKNDLNDIKKNIKITSEISQSEIVNCKEKPICRICLGEEHDNNNPLIDPCECSGTMKYIHLDCLRNLIKSKIKKTETDSCKIFTFKTLECDICKTPYSEKVKLKSNKTYTIIDFEKPEKDYIILDGFIKEIPKERSIFIVHFKNANPIKIGRASDANIRLSDISVSRAHALITQYNGDYYLNDTNSKFGTLISAGSKFCILNNKPFYIQKGKILFNFLMQKTLYSILTCYNPSSVPYHNYNEYFDENYLKNRSTNENLHPKKTTRTVSEFDSNSGSINKKPTVKIYSTLSGGSLKDSNNCINIKQNGENEEIHKTQDQTYNMGNFLSVFSRSNNGNVSAISNNVINNNDKNDDLFVCRFGNRGNNQNGI